uniref:Uncharacterized protein n=1 Tax=Moorena producens (strain JHB) TaxID=1454205 RepID=A0A1D9G182_MOOP1
MSPQSNVKTQASKLKIIFFMRSLKNDEPSPAYQAFAFLPSLKTSASEGHFLMLHKYSIPELNEYLGIKHVFVGDKQGK